MSREIKFRAWDKKRNVWLEAGQLLLGYVVAWESITIFSLKDRGNYEIVQYTGLKDKNGVEIYEGDILSVTSEILTNFGKTKTGRIGTTIDLVLWKEDSWGTKVISSNTRVVGSENKGLTVASKYAEIVGNIYETPELLKGAEDAEN